MEFHWSTDAELFSLMRKRLFPAVAGDVMDAMNLRRQFLPPQLRPIDPYPSPIGATLTQLLRPLAHTHIG